MYIRLSVFFVVYTYVCMYKSLCISLFFIGLCTEGLYRVSGNKTDQDNIQKQFDQGEVYRIKSFFNYFPY